MACSHTTLRSGYWTINLFLSLCNLNIIISQYSNSNNTNGTIDRNLPVNWPDQWNDGVIPFVYDLYSLTSVNRLINLVKTGHSHLQERSCLVFKEHDPVALARRRNFTYLFYSSSGVLESCCLKFFSKPVGRRLVLITPVCTLPEEVAHATLHALGLVHRKDERFSETRARNVLFVTPCEDREQKMTLFSKI